MRIITVRQPWAWAIIHGGKDVENRVRNLAGNYRGPVAIHAGLAVDEAGFEHPELRRSAWWKLRERLTHGAILGVVDLVGVHDSRMEGYGTRKGESRLGELIPLCSEWADPWAHHLVLANPRPLAEPIPFKGALGLRNLAVHSPTTYAAVLAQIGVS